MPTNPVPTTHTDNILVVDDEIAGLRLLTEILEKEGYKVRPAESPVTALESALAHPPGLILLDVRMPGMSGFELCRRLQQDERTRKIPIIFVTALQDMQDKIEGFEAGGVDFVSKPFQELEVLARVKNHLLLYRMQMHLEDLVTESTSELVRAQAEVRESEERFRTLVEQSPLSIQLFDNDGKIIKVNQAWKELWGISEEMLPEVLDKYNALEDEQLKKLGVMPLIEKAFGGEGVTLPVIDYDAPTTLESLEVGGAEGKKRWVRVQFYPIKNTKGEVFNVVSIEEDITTRMQAEQEILQYQHRLKALASQLTIAEEKERRTIAADLHDHVGHSLALARMQLNGILESDSDLERKILVKDISTIILQALQETRSLIFELSSPLMNEIGLGAAIAEWLEDKIEKSHGMKIEFSDTIPDSLRKTLDKNVRALIFRNVRELLNNVVKHSRAKTVVVSLKGRDDDIHIIIEDNGIGFDFDEVKARSGPKGGFGLFSIQERMTDLGGAVDIQSAPGKGCRVELTVPVKEKD